jgi:hypothetical protein
MKKTLHVFAIACISLLAVPAAAQIPAYVPSDGLVGWWPFNGNANDESGNGNDLTVNGGEFISDRDNNSTSAISLSSIGANITGAAASLNSLNVQTISYWFKLPQQFNNSSLYLIGNGITYSFGFALFVDQNNAAYGINNYMLGYVLGDGQTVTFFSNQTELSDWNNLVCEYDGQEMRMYFNGLLKNSFAFNGGINSVDDNIRIASWDNPTLPQNGSRCIDDIGIWNRALTQEEITALYTGEPVSPPAACNPLPSNLQQGLVGYWPFCGNANDESGNGNDGTVNGATLTEDRFGNADKAYYFAGGPNADADDIQFNNPITGDLNFSLCYWMESLNFGDSRHITLVGDNGNAFEFISHSDTTIFFRNWNGPQSTPVLDVIFDFDYSIASINNFCLVYNHFDLKMYVNGQVDSIVDFNSLVVPQNGLVTIGRHPFYENNVNSSHTGTLDDIGIWNRALTPEEVQELYTLDACTFTVYDTTHVTIYDTLTTYETVYDTLYTYETIYDTVTTYITVTDTLLIDITFTGFEGQPSWLNTVTVFPNPASDHITIDYGNFALMAGYNTIITDAAGATVYSSAVNSQQAYIDINAWGAAGVYYMTIYDASGTAVAVRHIVLE